MTSSTSKLPSEVRPQRFDPDLAAALEDLLEPYNGKPLEKAQKAIVRLRQRGITGSFGELVAMYREAIEQAVGK